jgi:hypothetical protein
VAGTIESRVNNVTGGSGSVNSFATIDVPNGTDPAASSGTDTLTLESSDSSVTITGNSSTKTINFQAAAAGANEALSNLSSVSVNASLVPGTNNSINIGSSSKGWENGYFTAAVGVNVGAAGSYTQISDSIFSAVGLQTVDSGGSCTGSFQAVSGNLQIYTYNVTSVIIGHPSYRPTNIKLLGPSNQFEVQQYVSAFGGGRAVTYQQVTSTGNIAVSNTCEIVLIITGSTQSTCTITFPNWGSTQDGSILYIMMGSGDTITTVTLAGQNSSTFDTTASTMLPSKTYSWMYNAGKNIWYAKGQGF